ncbi:hypothetical protein FEC37_18685, partial [Acinetobacter baumannii]|uniref:jacalin family lectin n=1 Tax=Acinetobacter baumannii TaxID=470 RepID=UPI001277D9F3
KMALPISAVEVGPWGGEDGAQWMFRLNVGERLTNIKICGTSSGVYSIQFTYMDINNISRDSPVYGGPGGEVYEISLDEKEVITGISGTFVLNYSTHITIQSLSFQTNQDTYGYGVPKGNTFSLPVPKGNFVGFFGKRGDRLDSIGAMLA